ncbi:MAG: OmpA family protein [Bacteroidales bacterium]|jgi:outer membrane protein OmpA-like peptidoglycan-associated protein|nr:OmpA family protein [Bacteroidales bacterium]MBR3451088.1 OmpA family protein [Bacteroidales bacterium]
MKKILSSLICAALILSGCGNMSNLAKGTAIGGGSGAAAGAGIGALIGKDAKGAAIGAAIGTAVGAGVGALIGNKMDKKAAELAAAMENANVETVTDANDLTAIKVTLESGILFNTSSSTLNETSKAALKKFAANLADLPETDLTILGHTDNTGTAEYNQQLSIDRAKSVATYLKNIGVKNHMAVEGRSFLEPVADNSTKEGRLQNRRVEIFITANENMIQQAEAGTLN